ncbi:MAG: methyltransferase domain-containing protein [Anaerolineales bacterium]|nr:methyltransferase domain-containing protein [Anaerolineales bacterium]
MTEPLAVPLDSELSYSLRRQHVDDFLTRQLGSLPPGSRLLDLGGVKHSTRGRGVRPGERLQVTVLNLVPDKGLDVLADAGRLPLAAGSYPAVLCSEVLEHVPDPLAVLQQIQRVLQPGGTLLITVPFLFRQHADPADYGRYTEWYWQENLQRLGFVDIAIEKQGLFGSVLADMLRHWWQQRIIEGTGGLPRVQRWLLPRLMAATRRRAVRFDRQHAQHPAWSSYTTGFGILAHKPA